MPVTEKHATDVASGLLRAYAASARVNEYLVERLDPAVWRAKPPVAKMRTIAAIVVHMHNCGLAYLKRDAPTVAVPPELDRFKTTQAAAIRALRAKRRAMLAVLEPALERRGKLGGSSHDPATFLTYYLAHDSHHRGQIVWQARLLGHPITQATMSGMWIWSKRSRE